jgi:hypothetical protein
MKKVLSIIAIAMLSNLANAQAFENKGNYVNFGFGLDPFSNTIGNAYFGYNHYKVGPVVIGYERGITEKLGIGRIGVGGLIGQSFEGYENYSKWMNTSVLVRGAYHFDFNIDRMDVYAGVGAGLSFASAEKYVNSSTIGSSSSVRGEQYIFAGIRYYFNDNLGVYAELGEGFMLANGGLVLKF